MSTPNFKMMNNFPLFVCCPEPDEDGECCELDFLCEEVRDALVDVNHDLLFHKISVSGGY